MKPDKTLYHLNPLHSTVHPSWCPGSSWASSSWSSSWFWLLPKWSELRKQTFGLFWLRFSSNLVASLMAATSSSVSGPSGSKNFIFSESVWQICVKRFLLFNQIFYSSGNSCWMEEVGPLRPRHSICNFLSPSEDFFDGSLHWLRLKMFHWQSPAKDCSES